MSGCEALGLTELVHINGWLRSLFLSAVVMVEFLELAMVVWTDCR